MSASSGESAPSLSAGRRLYRGVAFAVLIGLAGAGLSAVPALFVQTIFVSELQRCEEALRRAEADDEAPLCVDEFRDPPVWLPLAIVGGGTAIGAVGGLGYGLASPRPPRRGRDGPGEQWLPF